MPELPPVKRANLFNQNSGPPALPQSQAWPGLRKNMTPLPDRGEKSYTGTGRLGGRQACITGRIASLQFSDILRIF
jgi:hypothetical protein